MILITFLAPIIARFALQFGPAEFFSVFFLTFASFVGMGRGSPFKVLAAMCLGFALGSVGLDKMTGTLRMTFGHDELLVGFDFLIAVIGLFGIGEILSSMESGLKFRAATRSFAWMRCCRRGRSSEVLGHLDPQLHRRLLDGHHAGRGDPGLLHELRSPKRFSKRGNNFGKGEIEGVVAPETAAQRPAPPRCCQC